MIPRNIVRKTVLLIAAGLLAACSLGGQPPQVGEIQAKPSTTIMTGQKANLNIPISGSELTFEWSVQNGKLSDSTLPAVTYTAPDIPGFDTVTVKVKYNGGVIIRSITFEVVAAPPPTVTETPLPADTPTSTTAPEPTAAPQPIVCNHPSVTKNLFPQLKDENGQFPMYGPLEDSHVLCQAVYDIVHTPGGMAVHVKYENAGTNFGWWGVATPNGYDASQYKQLCFWAYAQAPNQSFRIKMKDTTKKEKGVVTIIDWTNEWKQICTNLSEFSDQGIQPDRMDNVNLGFEQPTGSAEIWIADFEFK